MNKKLAKAYRKTGNKQKALMHYQRALLLNKTDNDAAKTGSMLCDLTAGYEQTLQPREAVLTYLEAAEEWSRQDPPNYKAIRQSCMNGFALAIQHQLWQLAQELLKQVRRLDSDLDRTMLAVWQAQLAGQSGAASAVSQYAHLRNLVLRNLVLRNLVHDQPNKVQQIALTIADAGATRANQQRQWPDCPGLVMTGVEKGSPAERLGLVRGDIVLRRGAHCVRASTDFSETSSAAEPAAADWEVWKDGHLLHLSAVDISQGANLISF